MNVTRRQTEGNFILWYFNATQLLRLVHVVIVKVNFRV